MIIYLDFKIKIQIEMHIRMQLTTFIIKIKMLIYNCNTLSISKKKLVII